MFTKEEFEKYCKIAGEYHRPKDMIDDWSGFTEEEMEEVLKEMVEVFKESEKQNKEKIK